MSELLVKFKKLDPKAVTPKYSQLGDAGLDIVAIGKYYDEYGNTTYNTGLAFEIPKGYVGLLFPRSSVSKNLQMLANSVGVVDSGYRGEVLFKFKPTVEGHSRTASLFQEQYEVGEKIGQLVVLPYPHVELLESSELSDTDRGEGGFGSTGK